jgi:hypothetical protein
MASSAVKAFPIVLLLALLGGGCAPAVFFHESTKVAIAAEYKPDPSEPLSANFGLKRRIVAVVPVQEPATGDEKANKGEALSLVSRFEVRGTLRNKTGEEPLTIINNFASGTAARLLTAPHNSVVKTETPAGKEKITTTGDPETKVDALLNTELAAANTTAKTKAKSQKRKRASRVSTLLESELPITD